MTTAIFQKPKDLPIAYEQSAYSWKVCRGRISGYSERVKDEHTSHCRDHEIQLKSDEIVIVVENFQCYLVL